MKTINSIRRILYDSSVADTSIAAKFLVLENVEKISFDNEAGLSLLLDKARSDGIPSKEVLVLKEFRGRLFQKCPGSMGMICCNYYLINTCFDCLFGCSYCFLRLYLNSYGITQFTDISSVKDEIDFFLKETKRDLVRIGTGEFTDSLMFDQISGIALDLISFAASRGGILLEFKTKSDNIDHLLDAADKRGTVFAWSLNTPVNISLFEPGTASLEERISAAVRASAAGYFLAFHFDPVIIYEGYLEDYAAVIDELFKRVPADRVLWISLGGVRFPPSFKEILRYRHPDEKLFLDEMLVSDDGKLRYLKLTRKEIYSTLNDLIRKRAPRTFVYMCMETSGMWRDIFNLELSSSDMLEEHFLNHLKQNFPDAMPAPAD
jgi:spore photoproduct lyase